MSFYPFIKSFHSGWAFVVVFSSALLFLLTLYYYFSKKPITTGLKRISFYTVLSFHIQFLVGIILYILSPIVETAWKTGTAMITGNRLYTVEHPFMMFTAVILITIANAKLKKSPLIKTSTIIFMLLAIVCFYMIPWRAWLQ